MRVVHRWKAEGVSNREIARRLGISEKAVRKRLCRLGWREATPQQLALRLATADPKRSAPPPSLVQPATDKGKEGRYSRGDFGVFRTRRGGARAGTCR
jgi:predicted ArsR family transcriptional regulator